MGEDDDGAFMPDVDILVTVLRVCARERGIKVFMVGCETEFGR